MGFAGDRWEIYVSDKDSKFTPIKTSVEPRNFSVNLETDSLAYVGVDDRLYLTVDGEESEITTLVNQHSYTQPAFSSDGQVVYWVEMKDGNSKDTDIISFDVRNKTVEPVVTQRSAQFEPHTYKGSLYYSSVSCVNSCGNIIQELWQKDTTSGRSIQLTLLNQIAKQPVFSPSNNSIYFSSNASGGYGIWRHDLQTSAVSQITRDGIDLYPTVSEQGDLYFVRRTPAGANLMCKSGDDAPAMVPLPDKVLNLRELKVAL